jgi:hypothetical protein
VERSTLSEEYRTELKKLNMIDLSMNERLNDYSGWLLNRETHPSFSIQLKNRHDAIEWVDSVLSGVGSSGRQPDIFR